MNDFLPFNNHVKRFICVKALEFVAMVTSNGDILQYLLNDHQ
jgi:hypothetical protein